MRLIKRFVTGSTLISVLLVLTGCGGGGGGSSPPPPPPPPPPPASDTFSVTLTDIDLTRTADGAAVPVNGLPLDSNITVTVNN